MYQSIFCWKKKCTPLELHYWWMDWRGLSQRINGTGVKEGDEKKSVQGI